MFNVGVSIHFWLWWDEYGVSKLPVLEPAIKKLMKERSLCCRTSQNLVSKGQNIRSEISLIGENEPERNVKSFKIQYNKKLLIE